MDMKPGDRELGMDRRITRRDILNGFGAMAVGTVMPGRTLADLVAASKAGAVTGTYYPPALAGLRGNHPGSFETAHQLAREGRRDWGTAVEPDREIYDLVVIGGGISGLSAAWFFRQRHPDARILIIDNHDDFGGHAKRNEFQDVGRTVLAYGGSQSLEEPSGYSATAKNLLRELAVDIRRLGSAYDQDFYRRNGLAAGIHFCREQWGVERTIPFDLGVLGSYLPMASSSLSAARAVAQMPVSEPARNELLYLLTNKNDRLGEIPSAEREKYLGSISYRDFLAKHLNMRDPDAFRVLQDLTSDSGVGIEATPAIEALGYAGLPGRAATGLADTWWESEPYIYHFPDGNASVARLLVRSLIPAVARGRTMEDVILARFDYASLDMQKAPVRLRLNSTAVHVQHEGNPGSAQHVHVSYVRGGQLYRVRARSCVLACYNAMIPYLCPELPAGQREALAMQVKQPILYTSVAMRNWRAWRKLGIGAMIAPGSYHVVAMLDFPVSLGGYSFAAGPDDPIVVHMERFPHPNNSELSAREQFRVGRYELLSTSFETIERNIRGQLAGALAAGDFDPANDIVGITVNRWSHGYAYGYNALFDPVYEARDDERYAHVRARKRFGRIAIANSDAGASALLPTAVEQGYRAIEELGS